MKKEQKASASTHRGMGHLWLFELRFNVTAVTIAIAGVALAIASYSYIKYFRPSSTTEARDSNIETVRFIVSTIGTGFTVASAIYVADNIRAVANARRLEEDLRKTDRALKLIERWNSPSYNQLRFLIEVKIRLIRDGNAAAEEALRSATNVTSSEESENRNASNNERNQENQSYGEQDPYKLPPLIKDELKKDANFKTAVSDMLNFLEEVALAVRKGLVDEEIVKDYFRVIFSHYSTMFGTWIEVRQNDAATKSLIKNSTAQYIYKDFLWLNAEWRRLSDS
jgi:hypothetical protein